jgi:SRSO17 transposase
MNHDTKQSALPALTADFLRSSGCLVDNLFAGLWKEVGMKALLSRVGFQKRSGTPVNEVMFCLMLWVWLKSNSVAMFARESMSTFSASGRDALYTALNREDWNWRRLHLEIARKAVRSTCQTSSTKAFVLDDSIKIRHGKKMPGVSSHFDHTSGLHVMGQQVLTLGLSTECGFVPLDSELFTSKVKARALQQPFVDGRSIAAKRYRVAADQTKPQMAKAMIARALRAGFAAAYLLADSWFGTKTTIIMAEEAYLIPILRMKKNLMKYRLTEVLDGKIVRSEMNVNELFKSRVRCKWERISGLPYEAKVVDIELNLNESSDKAKCWRKVRLLFVRGIVEGDKAQAGKHDWAVFLTTDMGMEPLRILELYAMRWAIEVYFKEAKQHLGFLKEQGVHYASYIASIHLAAIRFCMLSIGQAIHQVDGVAEMRKQISANITNIDFAARLWLFFRALISGALDDLKILLGDVAAQVMEAIELRVQRFFVQALQLDPRTMRLEFS